MRKSKVAAVLLIVLGITFLSGCAAQSHMPADIIRIDLSAPNKSAPTGLAYLYELVTVDDSYDYLAHPDSILLQNGDILSLYPAGHGKGAILSKISTDKGKTWQSSLAQTPQSWVYSQETPTIYRLLFTDNSSKLIMISANPKWNKLRGDGFNVSLSNDECTFSEFVKFWGKDSSFPTSPIVAMSSLTRLKENGQFIDAWMGLFHDHNFINYRTILTFDANGNMCWSKPEPYLAKYRRIEKKAAICEAEVIRSDAGLGDELCLIARSNGKSGKKNYNSMIMFSGDEGKTWSEPKPVLAPLNGERHKAVYVGDRLFITFRSIERDPVLVKQYKEKGRNWYSQGWVAWVGSYSDLKQGQAGEYRIKLAHTYLPKQASPAPVANADTGYSGVVVLEDGTIVCCSYGTFGNKTSKGAYKTYIAGKRIKLEDLDELAIALGYK